MTLPDTMTIQLLYAPSVSEQHCESVTVPVGSRVQQVISQSQMLVRYPEIATLPCGVFGQQVSADSMLEQDDRLEVYRMLCIDPMETRKKRAKERKTSRKKQ